jgi:hypothetical protein
MLTPKYTMAIFITAATAYSINLCCLLGSYWWLGVVGVVCFLFGGLSEAFGAEGSLHQMYHLAAVTIISTGAVLLMVALQNVTKHADGLGTVLYELQLPWLNSSVQCWLGVLAVVALAMICCATKVTPDIDVVASSLP